MRRWTRGIAAALAVTSFVVWGTVASDSTPADSASMGTKQSPPPPPGAAPTAKDRLGPFAVVLVIDAARFDEVNLAQMPNLAALVAGGTQYSRAWTGELPSITETSHATIGTGVFPSHHQILGDTWRVPNSDTMAPNLLDSNLTRTGYIGKFIKQTGSPSMAEIVRQRWPGSTVVALSAHKVYAADALGAGQADFVGFGTKDARGHFIPSAIPGHAPTMSLLKSPQLDLPTYPRVPGVEDQWTTVYAMKYLFKYHPRLLMVNFPEVDIFGHVAGTDSTVMQPLLTNIDKQIGRLVAAYDRAGLLGQTDWVITSDHGMVPAVNTVNVDSIKAVVTHAGGDPLYIGHGDYSSIWLKNMDAVPRVSLALSKANIAHVAAVYAKNRKGQYRLVSPVARLADKRVVQAHLDMLASLNTAESPDIVLIYDENTITMTPQFQKLGRKGDHGGASWGAQHIPLILFGPGIKKGYVSTDPARLVDIAPTVETLLDAVPQHQDGMPLADALVNPPAGTLAFQKKSSARLSSDVDGLISEATLRPNTVPRSKGRH